MTRLASLLITLSAIILAGLWMSQASSELAWYRNLDMNIHNVDDALSFNAGNSPRLVDQPGLPLKYLLSLDYRVRHFAGQLPVHDMNEFSASSDLFPVIAHLVEVGRVHSQILVLFTILLAAGFVRLVSGSSFAAAATAGLLAGSEGLLFHGLMTRPELLCVTFGNIAALSFTWRGLQTQRNGYRALALVLAGVFVGLSVLSKIPGMWYLVVCGLWCFMAPVFPSRQKKAKRFPFWPQEWAQIALPSLAAGTAAVTLLALSRAGHPAGPVVEFRISLLAAAVAILPWIMVVKWPGRVLEFVRERGRYGLLVLTGAVLTVPATYLAISLIMPPSVAAEYTNRVLNVVFNPGGLIDELATNPEPGAELYKFVSRDWFLFSTAIFVSLATMFNQEVPRSIKKLVGLLVLCAIGIILMMSNRYFSLQYLIYCQVPLTLAITLGLHALWVSIPTPAYRWERRSAAVAAWAVLIFVALGAPRQLQQDHLEFQRKQNVPAYQHPLALIFLYHHDAHTDGYLKTMSDHFHSKENFAKELEQFILETGPKGIRH